MFATMADVVAIYDAMWQMLLPLWLMLLPFISCLLAGVIANYILFFLADVICQGGRWNSLPRWVWGLIL